MKVASWNVNSVRMRQARLVEWLASRRPDVLCLQEIKTLEAQFPCEVFRGLGYEAAVFGQKAYNGVAILSRLPMTEVSRGFLGDPEPVAASSPGTLEAPPVPGAGSDDPRSPADSQPFKAPQLPAGSQGPGAPGTTAASQASEIPRTPAGSQELEAHGTLLASQGLEAHGTLLASQGLEAHGALLASQDLGAPPAAVASRELEAHGALLASRGLGAPRAAVASREPELFPASERPLTEMPQPGPGAEARLLAATIAGIRIHSVYVPNGRTIFAESYAHKLRWLSRLGAHLDRLERTEPLLFCGDFNVAPDERDLYAPSAFGQDVIFHQDVRNAFAKLIGRGLVDTFRLHNQAGGHYSWWDYRMLGFAKNRGLRIDLILASEALARRCTAASIDREARKGAQPSDHAPIWAEFED